MHPGRVISLVISLATRLGKIQPNKPAQIKMLSGQNLSAQFLQFNAKHKNLKPKLNESFKTGKTTVNTGHAVRPTQHWYTEQVQ